MILELQALSPLKNPAASLCDGPRERVENKRRRTRMLGNARYLRQRQSLYCK